LTGSARRGRRPGPSTTREEILAAARASFAEQGFDRTSVRGVAARAGVDPALVHRFFGGKDALLIAAVEGVMRPAELIPAVVEGDPAELGSRLVAYFLDVWEDPASQEVMTGILRSAATNEHAAGVLRDVIGGQVLARVAARLGEDGPLRASLVASQLVGVALARYVLRFQPLASEPRERIAAAVGPTIQRYVTGDVAGPQPSSSSSSTSLERSRSASP
jgi:AcrR family transcriptional regulator